MAGAAWALALAATAAGAAVILAPPAPPPPAPAQPADPAVLAKAQQLNAQGLALNGEKRFAEAEVVLKQAMALCDGPLHGEHFCVAGVGSNLAVIAEARDDMSGAEALYGRAAAVTLAAMGPQDPQYGEIIIKLGKILVREGKYPQAEAALKTGLAIRSRIGDAHNTEVGLLELAQLLRLTGRFAEAERLLQQGLAFCPHGSPTCEATTRGQLGQVLFSMGRGEEGEVQLRKSAELYAAAGKPESAEAALLVLGNSLSVQGSYAAAEPLLKAQLAAMVARRSDPPANVAIVEADLAKIYVNLGRMAEAEPLVKSAEARLAAGSMSPFDQGALASKAGGVELSLDHRAVGRALLERALAIPTPDQALPTWWKVDAEGLMGDLAQYEQRIADAEAFYRKAADDYRAIANPGMSRLRRNNLAAVILGQNRIEEGERILKSLLAEVQAAQPADPQGVATVEANLALAANMRRDFKAARALALDALAKQAPAGVAPTLESSGVLDALGEAETGLGLYAEAEGHLVNSAKLLSANPLTSPGQLANARASLCNIYAFEGRTDDELACAKQVMALIAGWPYANDGWRASALLTEGNAYFDAGLYRQARDSFLAATRIDTPDNPRQAATAAVNLSQTYALMGEYGSAAAAMTRARELFVKAGLDANDDQGVESGRRLADLEVRLGRYKAAEPRIRTTLAWFEAHLGPDHPRTALQVRSLGGLMMESGRAAEAEPLFQRALAIRRGASASNLGEVAQSLGDLARCEMALGRYDQARDLFRQSESVEIEAKGKGHWYVGVAIRELGELDAAQGRMADAEANYRRAAPMLEGGGEAALEDLQVLEADRARLDIYAGRFDEAMPRLRSLLVAYEKAWGPDSVQLIDPLTMIAILDQGAGRYAAAQAGWTRILAIERKAYGDDSPRPAGAWIGLANTFLRTGRGPQADQAILTALAIQRGAEGLQSPGALDVLLGAAEVHAARGKLAEAQGEAAQGLTTARALKRDPAVVWALEVAGEVARRQERFADGEAALGEAVEKARALWGAESVSTASAMIDLAGLEISAGRPQKAEALFEQAGAAMRKALPADHLLNIYLINDLGLAYLAEGQAAKAEALVKPLLGRLAGRGGAADIAAGYVQLTLAKAYAAQGRAAEAAGAQAMARGLLGDDPPPPPTREQRL